MTSPELVAISLMYLIAIYHVLVAGWLVFFAERATRLLSAFALTKGVLGGALYLQVANPPWEWYAVVEEEITPVLLLVFLVYSGLVTAVIWRHFDLAAPWNRAGDLPGEARRR